MSKKRVMVSKLGRVAVLVAAGLAVACGGEAPLTDTDAEFEAATPTEAPLTAVILNGDGTPREVEYEVSTSGYAIIDGDVNIGLASQLEDERKGFGHTTNVWARRTVVYVWGDIGAEEKGFAQQAMLDWTAATGIRFRETDFGDTAWVKFNADEERCHCPIGDSGGGEGICGINSNCGQSSLRHELGHVIGLKHEHQRCDRDDVILYRAKRVIQRKIGNFSTICDSSYVQDGAVDFASLMMYGSTDFAKDSSLPPMVRQSDRSTWTRSSAISPSDARTVRALYPYFQSPLYVTAPIISNSATRNRFCIDNGYAGSESFSTRSILGQSLTAEYDSTARRWVSSVPIVPPFADKTVVKNITCRL